MSKPVLKLEEYVFQAPKVIDNGGEHQSNSILLLIDHEHGSFTIRPINLSGVPTIPNDEIVTNVRNAAEFGMNRLADVSNRK